MFIVGFILEISNSPHNQTLNLAKSFPRIFNYAPLKAIRNQRESKATIDRVAYKVLKRVEKEETESDAKSILAFLCRFWVSFPAYGELTDQ